MAIIRRRARWAPTLLVGVVVATGCGERKRGDERLLEYLKVAAGAFEGAIGRLEELTRSGQPCAPLTGGSRNVVAGERDRLEDRFNYVTMYFHTSETPLKGTFDRIAARFDSWNTERWRPAVAACDRCYEAAGSNSPACTVP